MPRHPSKRRLQLESLESRHQLSTTQTVTLIDSPNDSCAAEQQAIDHESGSGGALLLYSATSGLGSNSDSGSGSSSDSGSGAGSGSDSGLWIAPQIADFALEISQGKSVFHGTVIDDLSTACLTIVFGGTLAGYVATFRANCVFTLVVDAVANIQGLATTQTTDGDGNQSNTFHAVGTRDGKRTLVLGRGLRVLPSRSPRWISNHG